MLAVKRVTKKAYVYVFLAIISLLIWGYFVKSRLKPFFPSRLSFSILEWRKYSSIAPLTDIKLSLWPNECGFRNRNPVGIIFIRSSNSSSTIRSKLREKFAVLDSACGYRVIFEATDLSDSRPIGKFSDGLRQEVAQFDDIFGIGNQEPSTSPVYEKTLEAWMREKCGVKIATAVIVRGLVDNSLQALYKRSSMLVINLTMTANKSMTAFRQCLTKIYALGENGDSKALLPGFSTAATTNDMAHQADSKMVGYLMLDTQGQIVNPHNYSYIHFEPTFCANWTHTPPFMIIFTQTAISHYELRQKIRQTWASSESTTRNNIANLFFMGKTDNKALMRRVSNESNEYKDIIQEDYIDSYHNLTLKHISALKYFATLCKNVNYSIIMKTDDDMVLDVDAIVHYMKTTLNVSMSNQPSRNIYCFQIHYSLFIPRDRGNKWYVPPEAFPGNSYPQYCDGLGYIFSRDLVPAFYNLSLYTRTFWVDDVHITGTLAKNLGGVQRIQLPNQYGFPSYGTGAMEILTRKKWLVHLGGRADGFDLYWPVFVARWNKTARELFQKTTFQSSNTTLKDELFTFL